MAQRLKTDQEQSVAGSTDEQDRRLEEKVGKLKRTLRSAEESLKTHSWEAAQAKAAVAIAQAVVLLVDESLQEER